MEFGAFLKNVRREKKLTQKEMASLLGITREHYAQIESGRYEPSVKLLRAISSRLDVHVKIDFVNGGVSYGSEPVTEFYPQASKRRQKGRMLRLAE